MSTKTKSQRQRAVTEQEIVARKPFDIPYFAHQRLDPAQFPENVGLPIAFRPAQRVREAQLSAENDGYEDGGDVSASDGDAWEDDDSTENGGQKRKRKVLVRLDGETYKKMKVTGGRPAMAKKVTADMDSDDELIFSMKNAKYLEKDIAKRLADEGRMNYNPKTIGTRWARLKKAMQLKQDELLDAGETDWHEGDDEVLRGAVQKADEEVEKAKAKAEDRRWRIVADALKAAKPVTNFSRNACEKRFDDLQNGTAKPTPESDPDPSPAVKARIDARRERERKIEEDKMQLGPNQANIDGNGWTSRQRKHFD